MFPLNFIGYINGIFLIILFWHLARTEKMSLVNEPFSNLLSKEMHPLVFLSISTVAGIILTLKPPVYKYDVHHISAIICLGLMSIGAVILNLKLISLNIYSNFSLISLTVAIIMAGLLLYWGRLQKLNAKQESVILILLSFGTSP